MTKPTPLEKKSDAEAFVDYLVQQQAKLQQLETSIPALRRNLEVKKSTQSTHIQSQNLQQLQSQHVQVFSIESAEKVSRTDQFNVTQAQAKLTSAESQLNKIESLFTNRLSSLDLSVVSSFRANPSAKKQAMVSAVVANPPKALKDGAHLPTPKALRRQAGNLAGNLAGRIIRSSPTKLRTRLNSQGAGARDSSPADTPHTRPPRGGSM